MEKNQVITVDGKIYELKKDLTIAEQLLIEGKKQALTAGQWGALYQSPDPGDNTAAYTAMIVAELDVRMIKAPDEWVGAGNMSDMKAVRKVWKVFADEAKLFPPRTAGKDKSETDSDSKDGNGKSQSKDMVQSKVPDAAK